MSPFDVLGVLIVGAAAVSVTAFFWALWLDFRGEHAYQRNRTDRGVKDECR